MVRGSIGQTGPTAAMFDVDSVADVAGTDVAGVVVVVLTVADDAGVVVVVLTVADDAGVVVVVLTAVDVAEAVGVQAVAPRPKSEVVRTIRVS